MGNTMSAFQIFIAESVKHFPILYEANNVAQLDQDAVYHAYEAIAVIAEAAGFGEKTVRAVMREFRILRRKYYYVQYRIHNLHPLIGMASIQLQTQLVCHYLFHNIFHRTFINVEVRQLAADELMQRHGWIYVPGEAIAQVLHLLPPLPAVDAAHQQLQVPPVIDLIDIEELEEENAIPDLIQGQYPLPRRRAADYADLIIIEELEDENMIPDPIQGQYPLPRRRGADYADLIIIEELEDENMIPDPIQGLYPLPRRRAADYTDLIIVEVLVP